MRRQISTKVWAFDFRVSGLRFSRERLRVFGFMVPSCGTGSWQKGERSLALREKTLDDLQTSAGFATACSCPELQGVAKFLGFSCLSAENAPQALNQNWPLEIRTHS